MILTHLGFSGLSLHLGPATLLVDPPGAPDAPTLVTWTETERVAGVRQRRPPLLAAAPDVLRWLDLPGVATGAAPTPFAGWTVRALPYPPIPYATPREALRKSTSALRNPRLAFSRLRHTLRRPTTPPLAVEVTRDGVRIVLLGQALHRFTPPDALDRLVTAFRGADLLVAGTDYDDEVETGRLACAFDARITVIADLTGPIRRVLGLPTRPLTTVLAASPPGTRLLTEGASLDFGPIAPPSPPPPGGEAKTARCTP